MNLNFALFRHDANEALEPLICGYLICLLLLAILLLMRYVIQKVYTGSA